MEDLFVLSSTRDLYARLSGLVEGYRLQYFSGLEEILDSIYSSPPSLLVVRYESGIERFIAGLRDDPVFSHLPIMVVLGGECGSIDWERLPVDDYIREDYEPPELMLRLSLAVHRARRACETNPLTMLPGNTPIVKEVQRRLDIGDEFALAYADLDNFKPYNDRYGFSRGDEVIRMTGRLIKNIVQAYAHAGGFVGHIGGDDFVFIIPSGCIEDICGEITANFSRIVPTFYDPEDRDRGHILSRDRQGNERMFPLLSISIGVTVNRGNFGHYGEISAVASEMKKYAKSFSGSVWKVDRRQPASP